MKVREGVAVRRYQHRTPANPNPLLTPKAESFEPEAGWQRNVS